MLAMNHDSPILALTPAHSESVRITPYSRAGNERHSRLPRSVGFRTVQFQGHRKGYEPQHPFSLAHQPASNTTAH
jgi:hypothetical protein